MPEHDTTTHTPIEITVKGLQTQLNELREILSVQQQETPFSSEELVNSTQDKNQIATLQIENAKLKFRIKHLLNTLDKKDDEIAQLKKTL
ncbi:2057_t:CDS:2 [Acaulospora morrowiae]|uniref:2057_t:CDS:1 n=1 Tax=Acaulospora morrowiae TaxID=94023 RepID=A0A9N9GJX5_9GLOM|nr:2057_t:CDS:2 [Acaulospora morrowiae]